MRKNLFLKISGVVQGVNYRFAVKEYAENKGVDGWAKNENDGSVSLFAQGEERDLRDLIEFCYNGIKYAKVYEIKTRWQEATGDFIGFEIKY